ncbi:MAG TPA: diacylglycerol kinase family protein [Devosia sp.]|uniref:diacylglycerol/lipid kinase family protein n=1 Tax=Devosia sp. TaxID=1871048 RepID=UPI002F936B7D
MRFIAVLNRDGGTLRTMDLDDFCATISTSLARHGHSVDCRVVAGRDVTAELERAAADDADALLVAGGDGTISTAAAIAFTSGRPLAILPAGTMNLFARALKLPLTLNEAVDAVAAGTIGEIDIATANGRPFVHQFGVGVHARLVRIRDGMHYRSRIGKMLASLRAIAAAAMRPPRFEVELQTRQGIERRVVSGIAVSNNPLGDGQIHAGGLQAGVLGVYIAAPLTTGSLLRLVAKLFLGTWRESSMVSEREVEEVRLAFPRRKGGAQAVVDGELTDLDHAVTLRIHPRGLKVVVPADDQH